jgi:hypothetical protein
MVRLSDFLKEKKLISRWFVFITALTGMFVGAILMFFMALLGMVS